MGSGVSANRRGSELISPRAEAITKLKENGVSTCKVYQSN